MRRGKRVKATKRDREYAALVRAIETQAAFIANVLLDARDVELRAGIRHGRKQGERK